MTKQKVIRSGWMVFAPELTEEQVREKYHKLVGRKPDRIHSPEESGTKFWWVGWTTRVYPETGKIIYMKGGKK
ncbi:MAG: hypothetical protein WDA59_08180 [Methanofastidiosum sp.]|jgi:hypothetical protein